MSSKKGKEIRKLGNIRNGVSLFADKYNYIVQRKDEKGRIVSVTYFSKLEYLLTDLANDFVLDEIKELKKLKELSDKFDSFCEEIRNFCKKVEKEWSKDLLQLNGKEGDK